MKKVILYVMITMLFSLFAQAADIPPPATIQTTAMAPSAKTTVTKKSAAQAALFKDFLYRISPASNTAPNFEFDLQETTAALSYNSRDNHDGIVTNDDSAALSDYGTPVTNRMISLSPTINQGRENDVGYWRMPSAMSSTATQTIQTTFAAAQNAASTYNS